MKIEKREIKSLYLDNSYLDMRKRDIIDMIEGKWHLTNQSKEETVVNFDEIITFFILTGPDFIIFYNNEEARNEAQKLFENNFKKKGLFAEDEEPGIQSPQVVGPFDYNGKIGLWVSGKKSLNNITDVNKGIYKGIIVNPSKYFEVNEEVKLSSEKIINVLD